MAQQIVLTQKTADRILSAVDKVEKLTPTKGAAGMGDATSSRGGGAGGGGLPPAGEQETVLKAVAQNVWGIGFVKLHGT